MLSEFRDFIAKGNVMDLAVAVIIGAAFGAIVKSLTDEIIMPIVGAIFGNIDFSDRRSRAGHAAGRRARGRGEHPWSGGLRVRDHQLPDPRLHHLHDGALREQGHRKAVEAR